MEFVFTSVLNVEPHRQPTRLTLAAAFPLRRGLHDERRRFDIERRYADMVLEGRHGL